MLILTTNRGETTTITTPGGEVISVTFLTRNVQHQVSIGVKAPQDYTIMRDALRRRIIAEVASHHIFSVTSALHSCWIIAADSGMQAMAFYQQQYPNSIELAAELIDNPQEEYWFEQLLSHWTRMKGIPGGILLPL